MGKIRPSELDRRLSAGEDLFLLDIRPRDSYRRGCIDGAHNVPVYSDLQRGDDSSFRSQLDEIPREEDVVVICKAGIVAKKATAVLEGEGHDAATLLGGMSGWNGYQNGTIGYKLRSLLWRTVG
ncbi:rhodanese-like domain-containing protein [Halalkaliarchaeum sp. AArc-GB]|uniref:rhodanese-like domain-containing protein n=1 Tax=Halalkaliarchaeum sp. AArc-GB TaxID=3074078 RepID=UPI002855AB53|nr:rhodanese-like domain-containing protein [Halalkaliarchaeum sp. AArc-GB]MDR5674384.1 rhodanese-like domain-containing protein [Halalkaliarchaeum sp. AArc-GB]